MSDQKRMQRNADRGIVARYELFAEIMEGPNPLEQWEIKKLIEEWPMRYGFAKMWLNDHEKENE